MSSPATGSRTATLAVARPTGVPTTGAWRWARGLAVGTTASALATGGHRVGGGHPSLATVAVLTAGTVGLAVLGSARRWTTPALLGVLLGLQAAGHVAFASTGGSLPSAGPHAGHPGAHPTMQMSGLLMPGGGNGIAMLAGHLVAALVTALLLRRAEHWCWRLAEVATGALRAGRLLTACCRPAWRRLPAAVATYVVLRPGAAGRAHPRRGPPAGVLAG